MPYYEALKSYPNNSILNDSRWQQFKRFINYKSYQLGEMLRFISSLGLGDNPNFSMEAYSANIKDELTAPRGGTPPLPGGGLFKTRIGGLSGKAAATDIPSWAEGLFPKVGESGKEFAHRLMRSKFGTGQYPTGPGSEFNKLKKYADRAFE